MKGTEIYRLLGGVASESTAKMNTIFLKQYNEGLNEMFARLHASQHHAKGSTAYAEEYNNYMERFHQSTLHTSDVHIRTGSEPLEYDRYKFKRRSEANLFVQEMQRQGVEVTIAPFRQHGQILIEIPKKMTIRDGEDEEDKENKENKENKEKKNTECNPPVEIRTAQFVEEFTASTGIEAKRYTYYEDYGDAQRAYTQGTSAGEGYGIIQSEFINNMGELGTLLRYINIMNQLAVRHGDINQKHAFTDPTKHDGAGEEIGGRWSGNNPNLTKAAYVYNGKKEKVTVTEKKRIKVQEETPDGKVKTRWKTVEQEVEKLVQTGVVIIDGKEVTEDAVGAVILGRHRRRDELADRYISQYGIAQQAFGEITGKTHGIVGHVLGMKDGDATRTLFRFSQTNRRIAVNARDIKLSIKKQAYASGVEKHGRYDDGVNKGGIGAVRDLFGTQAIMLKKCAGTVEMTEDMMALLQKARLGGFLNATQNEFVDSFARRLSENNSCKIDLSFDDKINIINIVKSTQAYNDRHHFLNECEATLAEEMNMYAEDGGQFRLSKAEAAMFGDMNSPNAVKNQIDALKQDLGVEFHYCREDGDTLGAIQVRQINIGLEETLARRGIAYDETTGRFHNAEGIELNEHQFREELRNAADDAFGQIRGKGYADRLDKMLNRAGVSITEDGRLIHTHGNDISEWDILRMDKAFLTRAAENGFNFVTAAGTFDVKSLQQVLDNRDALSRLGMSEASVRAVLRFHENDGNALKQVFKGGAASWGNSLHKFRGEITKRGIGTVSKLSGGSSKLVGEGDEETAQALQMVNTVSQMPNHVRKAAAYTRQFGEGVGMRIDHVKQKLGVGSGNANQRNTQQVQQAKEKFIKAEQRKVDEAKIQKKVERDEKRLARLKKSEERLTKYEKAVHAFDIKDRTIEWFATKTVVGRAISSLTLAIKGFILKAVGTFLGVFTLLYAGLMLIIIVCSVIQSLSGLPYKGFKKIVSVLSDDTPAIIVLYRYMNDDLQEKWLDGLDDYNQMLENRADIKYGVAYDDFESYITSLGEFESIDNKFYINPFYKAGNNVPNENKTLIDKYDGKNSTHLITNPSVYGEKSNGASTESGHTNNLKDILAMTDVMYQFDLNGSSDEELHSILNESPAIIDFEHYWSEVVGRLKWAGKCVLHFFGFDGEADYPDKDDYWGHTTPYLTIQNYVSTLWTASHQEQIVLEPEFYSMQEYKANVDGEVKDISDSISQENASYLEICKSPVTSSFKLACNGSYIYPYLLNESGIKVDLSNSGNTASSRVRLVANKTNNTGHLKEDEDPCLWNSMAANEETYTAIKERTERLFGDCWDDGGTTEDYESFTATSDWCDDEDDAVDEAKAKVQARTNEIAGNPSELAVPEPYTLSADRDTFVKIWKEPCNKNGSQVGETETQEVEIGTETKPLRWSGTDTSYFGGDLYETDDSVTYPREVWSVIIKDFNGATVETGYADDTTSGDFENRGSDGTYDWYYVYTVNDGNETIELELGSGSFTASMEQHTYEKTVYKTQYKVTWKADVCCKYTHTMKRECEGHDFVYCGGHVACHINGCIYSCTNEQLALVGVQNTDVTPKAKYCADGHTEYNLSDNGFENILGKIDKEKVNYEASPAEASTTGGCESAATNIQGSDVVRGLNIWVEGGSLQKDMNVRTDISPQIYRDIFDVDMAIDKGDNVFPWGAVDEEGWRKYEAWSADNMTFVAMRTSIDWNDIYGFDIPLEIGSVSLSENDINLIVDGLKSEYGDTFTESREDAVKFALRWVGRGHYSEEHTDHDFFNELCYSHTMSHMYGGVTYSTSYDACCSAGNSRGFVNFYLNHFDKEKTTARFEHSWYNMGGTDSLYPADIVKHTPVLSDYLSYSFTEDDLTNKGGAGLRRGLEEIKDRDAYLVYIGVLNNSIFDEADADEIELSNGYVIKRGVPITVDLSPAPEEGLFSFGTNGSGSIFFRSENSSGYGEAKCTQNYYWFLNPDSHTRYLRFE